MGKNSLRLNKTEKSWVLYDVANSAFIMILTATIPIYFRMMAEREGMLDYATSLWGTATSVSVLILAVLSPIIGAFADYKDFRKKIFAFFLAMGIIAAICFTFSTGWMTFLLFFLISRIGYNACNMLYDAMLTDVADDDRMDYLSSMGYAMGYIGSCIPFVAGIVIIFVKPFGLDDDGAMRVSFLVTILWWALLSIPLFRNVKQVHFVERTSNLVSNTFVRLKKTFGKIRRDKKLFYYILAYFLFIDGVYTIISMATTYGSEMGIDSVSLILALLLTQFVAFPCALLAASLAERYGTVLMIKIFIIMYAFICLWGFRLSQAWEFWVLAVMVGMCQGGIQALSRSHFGKLIPKDEASEYFGLFDIFGKFADFLGPLIVAGCSLFLHSSRIGILSLMVLFAFGFILLQKSEKA